MLIYSALLIPNHAPIAHSNDAVAVRAHLRIVGNDHKSLLARSVELVHHAENIVGRLAIEVAGRFVGPDDGRLVDQGTCNGDALTLATRQLGGLVRGSIG